MEGKRLNLQLFLIYTIIIAAFLGSALFFSYLNTDAMMTAVEKETNLAATILATSISVENPVSSHQETTTQQDIAAKLGSRLSRSMKEVGVEIDVWVVDDTGSLKYVQGDAFPKSEWEASDLETLNPYASTMRWTGTRNLFWLDQSLFLIRPITGSKLYLVVLNHCSAIRAVQRRQFTFFVSIEMVLILTMMVLLSNTISSYRHMLIQLATTDELTGLANRKSFHRIFEVFAAKRKTSYSLFLVDIDYFKKINDGFAGRWGGDEFIGVLPLQGDEADVALNELCRRIRGETIEDDIHITISVGVAQGDPGIDLSRLSELADRALYVSKAKGRNQVSLYTPGQDDELAEMEIPDSKIRQNAFAPSEKKQAAALEQDSTENAPALSLPKQISRYLREKLLPALLLGVRWMAPFVAGGGILIGLAFLFDAASINLETLPLEQRANFGSITVVAAALKSIGDSTFNFMLPAFAGFMAYGLAGENAFMAGFIGGFMTISSKSGFIGAMFAGLAAGIIVVQMEKFNEHMPSFIRKAAPIIIYPVFNLLLIQLITVVIISPISNSVGELITGFLDSSLSNDSLGFGAMLGGMMSIDFGGIINKVAYNYGVGGLKIGNTRVMASVMAGGMIPPLGIALSMVLFKHKFTSEERERGIGTLFMGLSFITEGALPFVFSDALRVVPACMVGSALAGMLSPWHLAAPFPLPMAAYSSSPSWSTPSSMCLPFSVAPC